MLDLVGLIGIMLARCPVGVVASGMTGRVMLRKVSLVLRPSLTIMTCQKQILGSRHPCKMIFSIKGDFTTCFVKEYLAAHIAKDSNGEKIVDKARDLMS